MTYSHHHQSPKTGVASEPDSGGFLTPDAIAELLPTPPLLISPPDGWRGVTLQLYRQPPGVASTPGNRDHILVLHIAGKALIEDTMEGYRRQGWADAGCCSLTPAGIPLSRSWKGRPEFLLIYLDPVLLHEVCGDIDIDPARVDIAPRTAVREPVLHNLGALLHSEAVDPKFGADLMVDSISRALAVHLVRHHSSLSMVAPLPIQTLSSNRLNRVVDFMRANLDRRVSLSELADVCGLSATHFSRAFRKAAGMPPHAYLIDLRLKMALDLLEHTRMSITEIALECGFDQPQYFATTFRRKFGFTPSIWRIEHRS